MAIGEQEHQIKVTFDTTELEAKLAKAAVVVGTLTSRVESLEDRMESLHRQLAKAETEPRSLPRRKHRG